MSSFNKVYRRIIATPKANLNPKLWRVIGSAGTNMASNKVYRKIIATPKANLNPHLYSQAVQVNNFLFVSGNVGQDPVTKQIVPGGAVPETEMILKNIGAVLEAAGMTYKNVVKTTILLKDIKDYAAVNEVYCKYFVEPRPARTCYQAAALPRNVNVEIEVIASTDTIMTSRL